MKPNHPDKLSYLRPGFGWVEAGNDIFGRCDWCGGLSVLGTCQSCGHVTRCCRCGTVKRPDGSWRPSPVGSLANVSHSMCPGCYDLAIAEAMRGRE